MASLSDADEAQRMSKMHQAWIIDTLQKHDGACTYGDLVEVGEEHQCDTVGSMIKYLKNKKVITFGPGYLMYPMHSKEIVTLLDASLAGDLAEALVQAKAQAAGGPKQETAEVETTKDTTVEEVTEAVAEVAIGTPEEVGFFALEKLQKPPYPPGVDKSKRETYLEDDKFQELFKMDKATFAALAGWKRNSAKKKHSLF
jgi:hypothetical protein